MRSQPVNGYEEHAVGISQAWRIRGQRRDKIKSLVQPDRSADEQYT